jgi:hypothetical protein
MKTLYQILTAMSTYNFMDVPPSPIVNDHAGDGADQPVCDRGGLCVLWSEGSQPMDE